MTEALLALLVFALLAGACLFARGLSARMPEHHVSDETNTLVRLVANLFVVMTSLVFGLLINSSRASFESLESQIEAYAAHLILLDRTLENYGDETADARNLLINYVRTAVENPARVQGDEKLRSYAAEDRLTAVANAIATLSPQDDTRVALLADAKRQYQGILEARWTIIETGQRSIPVQLTVMLVCWLVLIFASFGYRAPRNAVVTGSFVTAAALISGSLWLVLDMNIPFSGPMQASDMPLRQTLAELERRPAP